MPRGLTLGRTTTREPEPEQLRFYDSPPPRMDASVCCLPAGAGTGAQHPHPATLPGLPSAGQPTIQPTYQYTADQIVPDRAQPDGLAVLGCNAQDGWQQISSATSSVTGAVTATTTAYIDYSWLQMQVSPNPPRVIRIGENDSDEVVVVATPKDAPAINVRRRTTCSRRCNFSTRQSATKRPRQKKRRIRDRDFRDSELTKRCYECTNLTRRHEF